MRGTAPALLGRLGELCSFFTEKLNEGFLRPTSLLVSRRGSLLKGPLTEACKA